MSELVTFGELMLRLSPRGHYAILQDEVLIATYGGGEANVAVSAQNYGIDSAFVSKFPNNPIGEGAITALRAFGVNTSKVLRGGKRMGVYYVEKGASQRASKVIYDRENSAVAMSLPEEYDWKSIFEGSKWFHFTGITPALSEKLAEATLEGCKTAKELGMTVSCDLNYRSKLWTPEKACKTMTILMPYVDVCIANEEDAEMVFGIRPQNQDINKGKLNMEGYIDVAQQLMAKFDLMKVAITLRKSISASQNKWSAMLYSGENAVFSKEYDIQLVDRVGGGDSFAGALIYALISDYTDEQAIEFATAASCLKQTYEGDFNRCTKADVENLLLSGSGRIQR